MFQFTINCDMFLIYVAANDISGKRVRISMVLRQVMKRVAISCCGRPPAEGENATRGELQRHRRQRVVLREAVGEGLVGGGNGAVRQYQAAVEVALGGRRQAAVEILA